MIEIDGNIKNPSCPAGSFLRNRILSCLSGHVVLGEEVGQSAGSHKIVMCENRGQTSAVDSLAPRTLLERPAGSRTHYIAPPQRFLLLVS